MNSDSIFYSISIALLSAFGASLIIVLIYEGWTAYKQKKNLEEEAQRFNALYSSFGEHKPKEKEVLWYLTVLLRNGTEYLWSNRDREPLNRPFLHWYFGRPQSEHFMMEFKNGKRLLRRTEIASFSMYWKHERRTGEVPPG